MFLHLGCFAKAFQRVPRSMSSSVTSAADMTGSITTLSEARTLMYVFEVNLEIKEDDGKVLIYHIYMCIMCTIFFTVNCHIVRAFLLTLERTKAVLSLRQTSKSNLPSAFVKYPKMDRNYTSNVVLECWWLLEGTSNTLTCNCSRW